MASLDYACANKSIIYVNTHKRKAPINMHPKLSKLSIVNSWKTPVILFSCHQPGRYVGKKTRKKICLFTVLSKSFRSCISSLLNVLSLCFTLCSGCGLYINRCVHKHASSLLLRNYWIEAFGYVSRLLGLSSLFNWRF